MARNALVLGGGGALGVAWETGLLAGLLEGGVDVSSADLIVGTSAGSVVGSQIALGRSLPDLVAQQMEEHDSSASLLAEIDVVATRDIFLRWAGITEVTQETRAEIGAMALAAKTASEERWLAMFGERLDGSLWPKRRLLVTAVDCANGDFQVWDRRSGVSLTLAVASSCAVPGLFPPVTINGRRYTDGGVRSGTSADLASGYDAALIIAPIGSRADGIDLLLGKQARAEAEALRATGSFVELVFPDSAALEAMGINRMDASRRGVSAEAGVAQGRALASRLGMWAKVGV